MCFISCGSIWNNFYQQHLPVPDHRMLVEIATGFQERWNFPHAVGCLDGKHIRILYPKKSGTMFYNYKNFFSIVLQTVADHRCRFIFVDVGGYGKQSDGGTFSASSLSTFLENCHTNLPPSSHIEGIVTDMPFVILADDAYQLKTYIMKPYSRRNLSHEEKIFNYRLSRARRCVECAFGIMTAKWRLLGKCIEINVGKAERIVKCICLLHNIIIDCEGGEFSSVTLQQSLNESPLQGNRSSRMYNKASQEAQIIRDTFKSYFNGVGAIPWQNGSIQ